MLYVILRQLYQVKQDIMRISIVEETGTEQKMTRRSNTAIRMDPKNLSDATTMAVAAGKTIKEDMYVSLLIATFGEKRGIPSNPSAWALLSTCSHHMAKSPSGLLDVRAESGEVTDVITGEKLPVVGAGRLEAYATDDKGRRIKITLKRVFVVPSLAVQNALSLAVFQRENGGNHLKFGGAGSHIMVRNNKIPIKKGDQHLFEIELRPYAGEHKADVGRGEGAATPIDVEPRTWHQRLGHRNILPSGNGRRYCYAGGAAETMHASQALR